MKMKMKMKECVSHEHFKQDNGIFVCKMMPPPPPRAVTLLAVGVGLHQCHAST